MKKSNIVYYIATFLVFTFILSIDVYAYCPLGPDVTKDLYGILMILKIVAPLLCIVLSVFDAIKAIAKGDPASDLKNVAKKFGKRMLYTIILFFLPVLVDIVFQAADVWDANGTCDLYTPENNQTQNSTSKYTGTTENCAGYTDKEHCDRDQKCLWDYNSNTCHVRTGGYNTTSKHMETTENCTGYTDKEHCDRDQKCSWNYSSNTCHLRK